MEKDKEKYMVHDDTGYSIGEKIEYTEQELKEQEERIKKYKEKYGF